MLQFHIIAYQDNKKMIMSGDKSVSQKVIERLLNCRFITFKLQIHSQYKGIRIDVNHGIYRFHHTNFLQGGYQVH